MTKEEAVKELTQIASEQAGDQEMAHSEADEVLLDYLDENAPEVSEAFRAARSAVGFWYA